MEPAKTLDWLQDNWEILTGAPWVFLTETVLAFIFAFLMCTWGYHRALATRQERIDALKERLDAKDQQLDEYRERLHLIPAKGSKFARMTLPELQAATLQLVQRMQHWLSDKEAAFRRNHDEKWHAMTRAKTEEERHVLWEESTRVSTEHYGSLMREYERDFKVDAILLRDELTTRLPDEPQTGRLRSSYENPVNTFGLKDVMVDLERVAKRLC